MVAVTVRPAWAACMGLGGARAAHRGAGAGSCSRPGEDAGRTASPRLARLSAARGSETVGCGRRGAACTELPLSGAAARFGTTWTCQLRAPWQSCRVLTVQMRLLRGGHMADIVLAARMPGAGAQRQVPITVVLKPAGGGTCGRSIERLPGIGGMLGTRTTG